MSKKMLALYLCITIVLLAGVGFGLYALFTADSNAVSATSTGLVSPTSPTEASGSTTSPSIGADGSASTETQPGTDTSYVSETTAVSVTTVSVGTGRDAVSYYVADIQLNGGAGLLSAFAEGFQSGKVAYTSSIAEANNALLAINGDYCTARNTGVIIRNGVVYQDIPARAGLAIYKGGTMTIYDETQTSAGQLLADGVYNTFSFGPPLLDEGVIPAGLDTTEIEDIGQEHTILGTQPRSGVGIVARNHFVFVVVDGRAPGYSRGVTLSEFAQIFQDLGCTTAYNLDGGGSSALYFQGELVNNPLGEGRERGMSDILYVGYGA